MLLLALKLHTTRSPCVKTPAVEGATASPYGLSWPNFGSTVEPMTIFFFKVANTEPDLAPESCIAGASVPTEGMFEAPLWPPQPAAKSAPSESRNGSERMRGFIVHLEIYQREKRPFSVGALHEESLKIAK